VRSGRDLGRPLAIARTPETRPGCRLVCFPRCRARSRRPAAAPGAALTLVHPLGALLVKATRERPAALVRRRGGRGPTKLLITPAPLIRSDVRAPRCYRNVISAKGEERFNYRRHNPCAISTVARLGSAICGRERCRTRPSTTRPWRVQRVFLCSAPAARPPPSTRGACGGFCPGGRQGLGEPAPRPPPPACGSHEPQAGSTSTRNFPGGRRSSFRQVKSYRGVSRLERGRARRRFYPTSLPRWSIPGEVVLVTGAVGGIGAATALQGHRHGFSVGRDCHQSPMRPRVRPAMRTPAGRGCGERRRCRRGSLRRAPVRRNGAGGSDDHGTLQHTRGVNGARAGRLDARSSRTFTHESLRVNVRRIRVLAAKPLRRMSDGSRWPRRRDRNVSRGRGHARGAPASSSTTAAVEGGGRHPPLGLSRGSHVRASGQRSPPGSRRSHIPTRPRSWPAGTHHNNHPLPMGRAGQPSTRSPDHLVLLSDARRIHRRRATGGRGR